MDWENRQIFINADKIRPTGLSQDGLAVAAREQENYFLQQLKVPAIFLVDKI